MKLKFLLSAAAILPGLASPAFAEDDKEIVVTAAGIEQDRSESGHSIAVIDSAQIRAWQATSISDILQTVAGVSTARSGPFGAQTSVFIRGAESSQTLVLVDGVRINDPSTPNASFDFGALLTGNIDRVEVLRGANSVIWGSQAIGGVVNIQTIAPTEELAINARAEYGSHGTAQASGNISGKFGIVSASVGAGYFRTDGISALSAGTEKDGYNNFSANAKFLVEFSPNFALDLRGYYNKGRVQFDDAFGFPIAGNTVPESDNKQFVGYAGLNHSFADGKFKGRLSYSRTDLTRTGSEAGAVGPFNYNVNRARGVVDRFAYDGSFKFANIATLIFGAAHENTFASTFFPLGGDVVPTTFETHYSSFYGQLGLQPASGLSINGGVRYEDHSQYGYHTTFGANAAYSPNGGATIIRASYAEGFRAPSLSEALPPFGNFNLKPETSQGYDVGIEQSFIDGNVTASATYFHRKSNDLIAYSFVTFQSENIARVESKGVELELKIRPTDNLDVRANYALVDATTQSPGANFGNQLARRPRDKANFIVDWQSPWGLKLGSTVTLTGDSFDNINNSFANRLDGYWLANVRAAFPIGDTFEIYGRVENLFDEDYTVVRNYSTYGRTATVGVRVKI